MIGALEKQEYFEFATTQREQIMTATTDLKSIVLDDAAENPGTNRQGIAVAELVASYTGPP
jgi:hypothetical protein